MALKIHLKFPAIVLLLIGTACQSRPFYQAGCGNLDWFEVGRRDGSTGRPAAAMEQHRNECKREFTSDAETLYTAGYNKGLVDYCSPSNGFALGRNGVIYANVCPPPMDQPFLTAVGRGQEAKALDQAGFELDQRLITLRQRLRRTPPGSVEHSGLEREISSIESEQESNRHRIERIRP